MQPGTTARERQELRQFNIGRRIFRSGKSCDACENALQREGWDDAYQERACEVEESEREESRREAYEQFHNLDISPDWSEHIPETLADLQEAACSGDLRLVADISFEARRVGASADDVADAIDSGLDMAAALR
jgi:hypothetical protein